MGLTKHPRVLEVVTAVLGPDVILLDSRFICKYPALKPAQEGESKREEGSGEERLPYVAWHQDMRYSRPDTLERGRGALESLNVFVFFLSCCRYWGVAGGPVLSVWLALDDSLKENGALQVIPGTNMFLIGLHLSPLSWLHFVRASFTAPTRVELCFLCRKPLLWHVAPSPSLPPWKHAVGQPGDPRGAGAGRRSCVLPPVSRTDVCEFITRPTLVEYE